MGTMSERIKLGILGAVRAYELLSAGIIPEQFELVAVCETDTAEFERSAPVFERLGIDIFPRFQPLLDKIDEVCRLLGKQSSAYFDESVTEPKKADEYVVDPVTGERLGKVKRLERKAVLLFGNPEDHARLSQRALRAGFDVLCEPPTVMSPSEAGRVERSASEGDHGGRVFALAEPECFSRGVLLARSLIRSRSLGDVRFAQVERTVTSEEAAKEPQAERTGLSDMIFKHFEKKHTGALACTEALGPLMFVTGLRARGIRSMVQTDFTGGSCDAYLLGLELVPKNAIAEKRANSPQRAFASCLYGRLSMPKSRVLRIFCEHGSIEVRGDRVTLHDLRSGRLHSTMHTDEGIVLPGMKNRYRTDYEYRQALMLAGFALRVLNINGDYCVDLYRTLDISMPGIMAERMQRDGLATIKVPNLRIESDRALCRSDKQ